MMRIELHREAPSKPMPGERCNGCGVCCAYSPCPLSRFLLSHRIGACPALTWDRACYVCGLVQAPTHYLHWLPVRLEPLARRLALRWIAADLGCDCDVEIE